MSSYYRWAYGESDVRPAEPRALAGQSVIGVANLGVHVHLVLDGRTICSQQPVDARDLYDPRVGLQAWAVGSQCGLCLRKIRGRRRDGYRA